MPNATRATPRSDATLNAALRPVHRAWLNEARRYLVPVAEPNADFWTLWGAVRYFDDNFRAWYRHERGLVEGLRPFLEPAQIERLQRSGEHLVRLRLEVDRIGRRRGPAEEAAAAARELLSQLELWCAEIEIAASELVVGALQPEAADRLTHLEAIAGRPTLTQ
jgi:hypothetical protein